MSGLGGVAVLTGSGNKGRGDFGLETGGGKSAGEEDISGDVTSRGLRTLSRFWGVRGVYVPVLGAVDPPARVEEADRERFI